MTVESPEHGKEHGKEHGCGLSFGKTDAFGVTSPHGEQEKKQQESEPETVSATAPIGKFTYVDEDGNPEISTDDIAITPDPPDTPSDEANEE